MSKQGAPTENKKPAPAAGGEQKAPPAQSHSAPSGGGGGKGNVGSKVGCHATGCKDKDVRYNFCDEHFRQFKFGLITKGGDLVVDYERKFEHYQNWKRAQKVA